MRCALVAAGIVLCALAAVPAKAGPPFVTDDPQPVAPGHWEIETGYAGTGDDRAHSGAFPFIELNWGPRRNAQLSLTIPYASSVEQKARNRGFGDLELGLKVRFVPEASLRPQIALYPVVAIPTGNATLHLGDGATSVFLPLWAQKQIGRFTLYGGGGIWNRGGSTPARWGQTGFVVEAALGERTMVGAELYHIGARGADEPAYSAFGIGGAHALGDGTRLLFSLGRAWQGAPHNTIYAAIEVLAGPHEPFSAPSIQGEAADMR
jgi:hypothetical protein